LTFHAGNVQVMESGLRTVKGTLQLSRCHSAQKNKLCAGVVVSHFGLLKLKIVILRAITHTMFMCNANGQNKTTFAIHKRVT